MALVHAAIGVAEGLVNAAVLEFLSTLDPGIVEAEGEIRRNRWATAGVLLVAALAVGGGLSALASSDPDGLERVAEDLGIGEGHSLLPGLLPDYAVPGVRSPFLSNLIAGVLGTLAVAGVLAIILIAIIAFGRRRKA
ncbi:MAG: PDGLE domain-containing protein [Planctomycetes bacterium]|nr:PDGLE domain-containing protein [Planctomycetota bacterium]